MKIGDWVHFKNIHTEEVEEYGDGEIIQIVQVVTPHDQTIQIQNTDEADSRYSLYISVQSVNTIRKYHGEEPEQVCGGKYCLNHAEYAWNVLPDEERRRMQDDMVNSSCDVTECDKRDGCLSCYNEKPQAA
jgi:hypothetical protein